jgi:hypothetical protein
MTRRTHPNWKNRAAKQAVPVRAAKRVTTTPLPRKGARGVNCGRYGPSLPPEDWHEPAEQVTSHYRVVVQEPGEGCCHVVTPEEIRQRLDQLPDFMLRPLNVVQLSRMTRKKRTFPCYGMQWGNSIYLYPLEESLIEYYARPPKPSELQEATMFGGQWVQEAGDLWTLQWTLEAIRDFYLNNVLIHELGHLLDDRNSRHRDRERYAEWFAIEYGYKPSRRKQMAAKAVRRVVRRHHTGG